MPFPIAAAVAGGASLLGAGINATAQGSMNRATREWNEKMYARQKQDNLDFWNMQNSYNSPEQTIQRHIAAGINPNSAFGNGPVGQSSSAPDTPHAMPYTPRAPQFDLPAIADTYFNIQSAAQRLSNEKQVGNNMLLQSQLMAEDLKTKKLNNTFGNETYNSKVRGFLGDNENKYQNAIKTYLNADLLDYLANSSTSLTPNGVRSVQRGDEGDSLLVKDWLANYRSKMLGNTLRSTAIQGNRLSNKIKDVQGKYTERMMSGKFEDMSANDIIRLLLQGVGLIPQFQK